MSDDITVKIEVAGLSPIQASYLAAHIDALTGGVPAQAAPEAAPVADPVEVIVDAPAVEAEPVEAEPVEAEPVEADLIAETEKQFKRAKSVTLGDSTKAKEGAEVALGETGEVVVIAACFRGRAVVDHEDGSRTVEGAADLIAVQADDAAALEAELAEDSAPESAPKVTEEDLRNAARDAVSKKGSAAVMATILDTAKAKKVSEVQPEQRADVVTALRSLIG